ncbi:hypothetical protein Tco_0952460 [Tanacetum coccineum]|uniref:Uncharacterized protein n=1 Tax=Tanacetum coccineum TaxID=301880 RepID=A0ABQ5DX14_9ASTR
MYVLLLDLLDIMANMNIPTNDAPVEQAPAVVPSTRMDDQILPLNKWVPIAKSNCILNVHKPQRNPIFLIVVALLKNTNFFWAFMASSTILTIYIQQDALDISLANDNNLFVAPPSSDTVIEYVNTLGYLSTLRNVSTMSVNALCQPWRAILSMINLCLTGKTAGYNRPRHPTFLTDRKNLATAARGKKKIAHLLIPSVRKGEEGGVTESSDATKVTKPKAAKVTKPAGDKAPNPTATQPPKPKPTPTQPSKAVLEKKRKLVKETPDEPSPVKRSKGRLVGKRRKPKSSLKLVDEPSDKGVPVEEPAHTDEEANLQRALHPPMHTEPTRHVDSPSLDAELPLTDSETKSDEEVPVINAGDQNERQARPNPGKQDKGQAGPNPGIQDEGQAGSNPGDAAESQPQPSHGVYARLNREHMDLEATNASSQQKPEQMDEEFTTTAYPNVQENLKLPTEDQKPHEEESGKTNAETEDQSMVSVPIHQDTSSVPLMTTPLSQAVDEIVTDAVDWAMQAPLRARFRDLPTVDMKEILQHWMFKDNSYKAYEVHNDLYEALQKSLELDYSNQRLADQDEARKKKRKKRATLRHPSRSPPSPPPPPPPRAGASGAPGISGTSGSSQLPPPPPSPSTSASGSAQQASSEAPSSSKPVVSTHQSMAWTTSDTRFESTNFTTAQELSPTDSLMNDHLPKADSRQDWWKLLHEEKRPATPEPAWTIPSSNVSDIENNWASTLVSTYETPAENSLLAKTGGMTTFMKWYCRQVKADFERQAYEVVKAFYPDVIHLQFQMEECHKMFTDQIDWTNPEGDQVRVDVNQPLPLGGPPGHGSNPALSISKMKAASYPDFGLELLVPKQMWIDDVCTYDISAKYGISHWWFNRHKFYIDRHDSPSRRKDVRTHMRILSVVRIKAYSRYGYDYLSEIVLRRANFLEHTIAEKGFKNLYPNNFKDLNLLLLQGHLDHLPSSDKRMLSTAVKLWTRNLVIRQRVEDFQLGIESYQTQLNLTKPGWDATCYEFKHDYTIIESPRAVVFLTEKEVTRSKEFIAAIKRRLKTRRIYRNLECFVGGRVRDIDYILL